MSGNQKLDLPFELIGRRFSRRQVLKGAAMAGAGLGLSSLLAACQEEAPSATGSPSPSAGTPSAEPKAGGTLVYARRAATETLNPLQNRTGNGDIFADELVFTALVRPDPMGSSELVPGLAERWEVSDNGLDYTFHIRDARFSNGDPVTADDVKFSLDRFGDPELNAIYGVLAVGYEGTEVVDQSTVIVHVSQPVSAFLYNISILPAFIVPKNLVEQQGDEEFFKRPVGTGPFVVKEWLSGSHITFSRNTQYWEPGKPYLDEVRYDFIEDDNARMLALQSGRAQAADGVPFSQIESLEDDSTMYLQFAEVPYFQGMWLNNEKPEFADVKVRQALQYAIDKPAINEAVYAGVGTIPNSVLPPLRYDASAEELAPYPYDVAKARELMAESTFPNGFNTTLQYPAGFAYYKQLTLVLQSAWKEIGVDVQLIEQDQGTTSDRFYQLDYDMTFPYAQFTSDVVVPDEYIAFVADPDSGTNGFFSGWHDPAIWQMTQEFLTADEATRTTLWPQIQKEMLEQTPFINIMNLPFIQAYRSNVRDPLINALGANRLEATWLA